MTKRFRSRLARARPMTDTPLTQDPAAAHSLAAGRREPGAASRLTHLALPRDALVSRPGRLH